MTKHVQYKNMTEHVHIIEQGTSRFPCLISQNLLRRAVVIGLYKVVGIRQKIPIIRNHIIQQNYKISSVRLKNEALI